MHDNYMFKIISDIINYKEYQIYDYNSMGKYVSRNHSFNVPEKLTYNIINYDNLEMNNLCISINCGLTLIYFKTETKYNFDIFETNEVNYFIKLFSMVKNKNYMRDLFVANTSHEIRTPLNGIIGFTQLLNNTKLDKYQKEYLKCMGDCCTQLLQTLNDILDFSKLTSGNMKINSDCFKIEDIVGIIQNTINYKLKEKKQNLIITVSKDIPQYILSDKSKIIQILINLISNSIKFTDIEKNINLNFNIKNENTLEFVLIDEGIGIPKEKRKTIFDAYNQIENTDTKEGLGLGLPICKKLVEILKGNIEICDSVKGTKIKVEIQFEDYKTIENNMKDNLELLQNKHVLIVDDNSNNRIILSEMLFEWKMQPIICASGFEALRMFVGKRYDFSLALIDICMPGTSGTELAKQIKEEDPDFPMIALSSIESFVSSSDFETKLNKPLNKIQLFNSIYNILIKNTNSEINNTKLIEDKKILIAEDVEYNSKLLQIILNNTGYHNIDICADGLETYNMIKKNNYDLVLLDIKMPSLTGFQIIDRLKSEKEQIPKIIAITASTNQDCKNKCKQLEIDVIDKPFNIHRLKSMILKN